MTYNKQYGQFLVKMGKMSGQASLCEAIHDAYKACCESSIEANCNALNEGLYDRLFGDNYGHTPSSTPQNPKNAPLRKLKPAMDAFLREMDRLDIDSGSVKVVLGALASTGLLLGGGMQAYNMARDARDQADKEYMQCVTKDDPNYTDHLYTPKFGNKEQSCYDLAKSNHPYTYCGEDQATRLAKLDPNRSVINNTHCH